jgi:hypothetical protein
MPVVSMMKNGLPPARLAISAASVSPIRPPPACRTRSIEGDRVHGVRPPGRPLVEELRTRQDEHHRPAGAGPGPGAETLDEVEHRRPERVRILEHEHGRQLVLQAIDQRHEPRLDVVHERRLPVRARAVLGHPEQEGEPFHHPVDLGGFAHPIHELTQPLPDLLRWVALLHAGQLANDLGHRCERRRVRVGAGATGEDDHVVAQPGHELVGEA